MAYVFGTVKNIVKCNISRFIYLLSFWWQISLLLLIKKKIYEKWTEPIMLFTSSLNMVSKRHWLKCCLFILLYVSFIVLRHSVLINTFPFPTFRRILDALNVGWRESSINWIFYKIFPLKLEWNPQPSRLQSDTLK